MNIIRTGILEKYDFTSLLQNIPKVPSVLV